VFIVENEPDLTRERNIFKFRQIISRFSATWSLFLFDDSLEGRERGGRGTCSVSNYNMDVAYWYVPAHTKPERFYSPHIASTRLHACIYTEKYPLCC